MLIENFIQFLLLFFIYTPVKILLKVNSFLIVHYYKIIINIHFSSFIISFLQNYDALYINDIKRSKFYNFKLIFYEYKIIVISFLKK